MAARWLEPNRNLNLLHPIFKVMLINGLAKARAQGLKVYVFEAWRSKERQDWLYSQGRTRDGQIVTNVTAGFSWHQYGLAADLVFDGAERPGIQWSWDGDYIKSNGNDYEELAKIMTSAGLVQLKNHKGQVIEMPHFQIDIEMTIHNARRLAKKHGELALWDTVDALLFAA